MGWRVAVFERVVAACAEAFCVSVDDICGLSRFKDVARARMAATLIGQDDHGLTSQQMVAVLDRHPSTLRTARRRGLQLQRTCEDFAKDLAEARLCYAERGCVDAALFDAIDAGLRRGGRLDVLLAPGGVLDRGVPEGLRAGVAKDCRDWPRAKRALPDCARFRSLWVAGFDVRGIARNLEISPRLVRVLAEYHGYPSQSECNFKPGVISERMPRRAPAANSQALLAVYGSQGVNACDVVPPVAACQVSPDLSCMAARFGADFVGELSRLPPSGARYAEIERVAHAHGVTARTARAAYHRVRAAQ
jgi:hypothetical protein